MLPAGIALPLQSVASVDAGAMVLDPVGHLMHCVVAVISGWYVPTAQGTTDVLVPFAAPFVEV
jgi:hypothetical protein